MSRISPSNCSGGGGVLAASFAKYAIAHFATRNITKSNDQEINNVVDQLAVPQQRFTGLYSGVNLLGRCSGVKLAAEVDKFRLEIYSSGHESNDRLDNTIGKSCNDLSKRGTQYNGDRQIEYVAPSDKCLEFTKHKLRFLRLFFDWIKR